LFTQGLHEGVLFSGSGVVSRFVFMPVTPTSAVNAHFLYRMCIITGETTLAFITVLYYTRFSAREYSSKILKCIKKGYTRETTL
jgi:hypothetical protein